MGRTLMGQTVLMVGFGGIAMELAPRLKAFGVADYHGGQARPVGRGGSRTAAARGRGARGRQGGPGRHAPEAGEGRHCGAAVRADA